jgi:hypothetical protein
MADSKKPVVVQVVNAIAHAVTQLVVWAAAFYAVKHGVDPVQAFGAAAVLTGIGGAELLRGKPPVSGVLMAFAPLKKLGLVLPFLLATGCGLFGRHEPTVRALTPVLVQVAEHVGNRGLELAELPAQCKWEQSANDPEKLIVSCTVDTGKR